MQEDSHYTLKSLDPFHKEKMGLKYPKKVKNGAIPKRKVWHLFMDKIKDILLDEKRELKISIYPQKARNFI